MNTEFDYDLTRDQWEALKALRLPAAERRIRDRLVVSLTALELAAMTGDGPVITPKGRSVLLRGSPFFWMWPHDQALEPNPACWRRLQLSAISASGLSEITSSIGSSVHPISFMADAMPASGTSP